MLRNMISLCGSVIRASDGEIGSVHDFLFEDDTWEVKYVVVDTGTWLGGRNVLLPPSAIGLPDWSSRALPVPLTRQQVRESPDIDSDKPVSRQQWNLLHNFYGWPGFLAGAGFIGAPAIPPPLTSEEENEIAMIEETSDPHLRSIRQVRGYHVSARDGEFGRVCSFLLDDADWVIPFIIAQTSKVASTRTMLVPTCWVKAISWAEHAVHLDRWQKAFVGEPEDSSTADAFQVYERRPRSGGA